MYIEGVRVTSRVAMKRDATRLRVEGASTIPLGSASIKKLPKSLLLSRKTAYDDVSPAYAHTSSDPDDEQLDRISSEDEERRDLKRVNKIARTCLRMTNENKGTYYYCPNKFDLH